MSVAPITYANIKKFKTIPSFPEFVIQAVNECLISKYSAARDSHTIHYSEIKNLFEEKIQEHFKKTGETLTIEKSFYDFENLYRHFGWNVSVSSPAYNESGGTSWSFEANKKRPVKKQSEITTPVTPKECHQNFLKTVPDYVIQAANELIQERFSENSTFEFNIPDLVQKIAKIKNLPKQDKDYLVSDLNIDNRFLDLECIYNKDWDVKFVKLPYYETSPDYWIFSTKKSAKY